jgi:energy-converting hydrogenase Eha subunit C
MLEERNPVVRLLTRIKVLVEYNVTCAYIDLFRGIATLGAVCNVLLCFSYFLRLSSPALVLFSLE